jgi:regulator of cell morphogenesis and NO signaling
LFRINLNEEGMNNTGENILDVTTLHPTAKHPAIFNRFEDLLQGEDMIIHNDHDPKPLYYQMVGELGNTFTWEYLEEGPVWWKVKLTKNIPENNQKTIGELAANDLRKVEIFKKYGLDFCCGGNKTVKQACAEQGIDETKIEQELLLADKIVVKNPLPYNDWDLDFLADFIVNTHHKYVRKSLPEIREYALKVAEVHGGNHPELNPVHKLVEDMNRELVSHMQKEEEILFPYIKELTSLKGAENSVKNGSVKVPIGMMMAEHETVGEILKEIRRRTNDYTLPDDGCATYAILFQMLNEFEGDLHIHIHLENNILFPKAEQLEHSLAGS